MKSGCRSCGLAAASSSALGISRRKITHTFTSIWAMPVRSSAPIALRYSVSIRAWAHTKPIRQIVLTVTWTELKSSNQRQAPSSCSLGAVHDGHERSEFGRMQASRQRSNATPTFAIFGTAGSRPSLDYFLTGTCCCAGVVLVIASRCHRYTCRILRRR